MSVLKTAKNAVLLAGITKGMDWLSQRQAELGGEDSSYQWTSKAASRTGENRRSNGMPSPEELSYSSGSHKPVYSRSRKARHSMKNYTQAHPYRSSLAVLVPMLIVGGLLWQRRRQTV